MTQYIWPPCPASIQTQLEQLIAEIHSYLASGLVGIYLHGSLAMGCFNPNLSDLDLLVITGQGMAIETKRTMAQLLLRLSGQPGPIEISFLQQAQLAPWRHPAPFDFHYSEMWRATYERDLASPAWQAWNDSQPHDPDLAAHIMITTHRGVCLSGAAIAEVFPTVPRQDYIDSIMGDVLDGLDHIQANPVYAVLNACRTYAYLRHGHIYSKAEGGVWALQAMPNPWPALIKLTLAAYRGEAEAYPMEKDLLEAFAAYMRSTLGQLS